MNGEIKNKTSATTASKFTFRLMRANWRLFVSMLVVALMGIYVSWSSKKYEELFVAMEYKRAREQLSLISLFFNKEIDSSLKERLIKSHVEDAIIVYEELDYWIDQEGVKLIDELVMEAGAEYRDLEVLIEYIENNESKYDLDIGDLRKKRDGAERQLGFP